MAKTESIKGLKFSLRKTARKETGVLVVKSGKKEFKVPVEVSTARGENFIYLSAPAFTGVYKFSGDVLADATDADTKLAKEQLQPKGSGGSAKAKDPKVVEWEEKIAQVMKQAPSGYKLTGIDKATGMPKIGKGRASKKGAESSGG